MSLQADTLDDLAINEDRQVYVGADNDLAIATDIQNVKQSVAIHAGNVLRPLVGEPTTPETLSDVEAELKRILRRDVQIESVNDVSVERVNTTTGTVTVEVFMEMNNSFELSVVV